MSLLQSILVYLALGIALFYLLKKFLLPRKWFTGKKSRTTGCGQGDCECH